MILDELKKKIDAGEVTVQPDKPIGGGFAKSYVMKKWQPDNAPKTDTVEPHRPHRVSYIITVSDKSDKDPVKATMLAKAAVLQWNNEFACHADNDDEKSFQAYPFVTGTPNQFRLTVSSHYPEYIDRLNAMAVPQKRGVAL